MHRRLRLASNGDGITVRLPSDMTERLHLSADAAVLAIETERGILLAPHHPPVEEALALAAKVSGKYHNALRELAK